MRSRAYALLLYPQEDETHLKALYKIKEKYNYAMIEHNRDVWEDDGKDHNKGDLKKTHIHVVLKFENAKSKKKLAKELEIKENYIQKSNFVAMVRYLIHKDDPFKTQYNSWEIATNMKKEVITAINLKGDYSRNTTALILQEIKAKNILNFYQLVMWAEQEGYLSEIMKNAYFYKNLLIK